MKTVITYGTFDLFHEGHLRLLQRAKALGDRLIVGVTSEEYDRNRGKLNVVQSLSERIENVRRTGLADLIIVEEYEGQKIEDIQKYNVDIFVIGSDWKGKFDYLKEYCDVVYLERTRGVSSTLIRNSKFGIVKLGIAGYGRIANRFIPETKYVSGVSVIGVYGRNIKKAKEFAEKYELAFYTDYFDELLKKVDAVYIATPHHTHYNLAKKAILKGKHLLIEKPITLDPKETKELFSLAKQKKLTIMEGIKTAYAPGFIKLINMAKTGIIGKIVSVKATFTKLVEDYSLREFNKDMFGGSVTELSSYVILPFLKLFGTNIEDFSFYSIFDKNKDVDIFTTIVLKFKDKGFAYGTIGLKGKSEGDLIISGTKGYVYVPSPWWKTHYFEIRDDNGNIIRRFADKFDGEGLRYQLAEFIKRIWKKESVTHLLKEEESIKITEIIYNFLKKEKVNIISKEL